MKYIMTPTLIAAAHVCDRNAQQAISYKLVSGVAAYTNLHTGHSTSLAGTFIELPGRRLSCLTRPLSRP